MNATRTVRNVIVGAALGPAVLAGGVAAHEADEASSAVVRVEVERPADRCRAAWTWSGLGPLLDGAALQLDDVCRPAPLRPEPAAAGAGFVARPDGLVATSRDLVAGAERVVVVLADGRRHEAAVLPGARCGVALLRIGGRGLPTLGLAPADPEPGAALTLDDGVRRATCAAADASASAGCGPALVATAWLAAGVGALGAPVLDAEGRVAGIATGITRVDLPFGLDLAAVELSPASALRRALGEEAPPAMSPASPWWPLSGLDALGPAD